MKILIASDPYGNKAAIRAQLLAADIQISDVAYVESGKALLDAIKSDRYDFIITEYTVGEMDVWRLSTLINSTHYRQYSCPVFLIKETCQIEIPSLLAKEYSFSVLSLDNLGEIFNIGSYHSNGTDCWHQNLIRNTLLIIEDDKDASLTAYHALKEVYDIDLAVDGLSGYDLWEKNRHDLVLLDLMLPKISGEEILKKIMAVNKNQSVIIVTALDKPILQNKLLLNGASEYLCKPFSLFELRALCQILLNKSKLLHQAYYSQSKMNSVRNLVWLLDYALVKNETEKVKTILKSLKHMLPNNLMEDEKISLLTRGF